MTLTQLFMLRDEYDQVVVCGVAIGSCVDGDRWTQGEVAHCHYSDGKRRKGAWRADGWICIRSPRNVLRRDGKQVSRWILHELAHLLVKGGHGAAWRRVMHELGEHIDSQYLTRRRAG